MALHDEHADILGGPILQRPESGLFATFSQYRFVLKPFTLLGFGFLVWIACARGLEHLKKHRELRYRKAMRRKHGIPDSDCRPFAVAYAAAKRAHLEREAQDRKKTTNYVSDHNSPAVDQRTNAQKDARGLRRRVPETTQLYDYQLPEKHASLYDNKRPDVRFLNFTDRYNPGSRHRVAIPETLPVERPAVRRTSKKDLVINLDDHEESRKRSFEAESDVEHETIKKSRIDGDELKDGEEQADWYAQYSDMSPRQASKESLDQQPDDNYVHMNGQEKSKHVSDLCDEDHEPVDETMEGVDEDEVTQLKAVARGKKRGRAEAGSTFGGDDEEDIRNGRASHYRKRRTILRRKTEIAARGQKRDRGAESPESEGEGGGSETSRRPAQRSSKKKRGKKAVSDGVNEISVEGSRVPEDSLCGGRKVGDEWEADGVQYKVGDKGERLRLTLVKKARNKYHTAGLPKSEFYISLTLAIQPQDSEHLDRRAPLEIYVETWMTEEQYKQTEGRQELAWQEASRESSGSRTPDVLDSPTRNGKNLLWDSVKGSPARRPFRQFMPAGASPRVNPFEQWQWQWQPSLGRRVASSSTIVSPIPPGVADSPTRPGFRGFSKWEKQDREAEAMARIRAKIEEQKKAQGPPQKPAEITTSVTAPELGTKPLSVPTITLTPVSAVTAEGKSDDNISPSKSNTSTFSFAAPPSTGDSIKGTTAAPSATTGSSLPSTSIPAATPSSLIPSAPNAPTTTSTTASLPPFSFAKPPQVPSSASTTTSSSAMPNFFEKGTGAGMPSASSPSPSNLGATTQPPLAEGASKPASFSFAKPDSSSSSPAVVALPTTKSQVPIFGATPSSTPSPMTFGSTPAAAKTEALVPAPVSTPATTSESSKPTVPLFSISSAPSSSSTPILPASSTSLAPKFSFGQSSTTSTSKPGFNLAPGTASQPKPTFKFGQTLPSATDGASVSTFPAADESKKSVVPVSVFGTTAGSNEPAKPSPFGTAPAFGSSTLSSPSASAMNLFGRPVALDGDPSTSMPPKSTLASSSTTISSNTFFSTPAGAPASGNAPVFSFGGTKSSSKSAEGSKPASLFGGAAGGPKPVSMFGGSSTEGKPTFAFSTSAEGSKPTSVFGGNAESSKPPSAFGRSAEGSKPTFAFGGSAEASKPPPVFGGAVEGSQPTFAFSCATENKSMSGPTAEDPKSTALFATASDNSLPSNTIDAPKSTPIPGSTTSGPSYSVSSFTFGKKDDAATNTATSTRTQVTPVTSFTFGVPSGATGLMFGQPSTFVTSGDSSHSAFGKPVNTTFGSVGTGSSGSPNTFAFGKPATQNQKQEQ